MTRKLDYNQIVPDAAKAPCGVFGYVMQSGLPSELVDVVYLRLSWINNCADCLDILTRDVLRKRVNVEKLALAQASEEGGGLFSAAERAALACAESVTPVGETGAPESAYR